MDDNISGKMILLAVDQFSNIIDYHQEVPTEEREGLKLSITDYFNSFAEKHGPAWLPSKNFICNFKNADCEKRTFTYSDPIRFEDFIAESFPLLGKVFRFDSLLRHMQMIQHGDDVDKQIGKGVLYKGLFGYMLIIEMIGIYYKIPFLYGEDTPDSYLCDSMLFNDWWNTVVNSHLMTLHYKDMEDGQEHTKDIYVKPTIAVNPQRQFAIFGCRTMDYNDYKD